MDVIPIDYEVLRLIWWALLGILLIAFAILGGMDLGVGALMPAVARTDDERRVLINADAREIEIPFAGIRRSNLVPDHLTPLEGAR